MSVEVPFGLWEGCWSAPTPASIRSGPRLQEQPTPTSDPDHDHRNTPSFKVEVGVRQGCVMSLWLFNIYMDGCIRDMKVRVQDLGARLNVRGVEQPLVAGLYADDPVLLAASEGLIQRIADEFDSVCKWRQLKVNAGKSKVMVFERAKQQKIYSSVLL